MWGGMNFTERARNIRYEMALDENNENVPYLIAELMDDVGGWFTSRLRLPDRIGNDNGNFVYVQP